MDIEFLRDFCLQKRGATEGFPFDDRVLVFKVLGKMFALVDVEEAAFVNLKCDPQKAIFLREEFAGIKPGYHMHKKYWNSVSLHEDVPDTKIQYLINHSYELVVSKLPKKDREVLIKGEIK